MELDHLVVACENLDAGTRTVETLLGVTMETGGQHATMGTHNRLLSLGSDLYLEVIAIDPDGHAPDRPRWFALDRFSGPPRLTNWVMRCDDLDAAPKDAGEIMELERGDLRWRMAVPRDGMLPYDGLFPGLIQWQGAAHPAGRLPDRGCRLERLEIIHPDAVALQQTIEAPQAVVFTTSPVPALRATIATPGGIVALQ